MCVIAVKPAGVKWPVSRYLKNCYRSNPDGAGIAWVDDDGVHIKKGYFGWKGLYRDLRVLEPYPVMLHCRIATHGKINTDNCHPFELSNGVAMAHNGIIDMEPLEADMTDSESFGKTYLEQFSPDELEDPRIQGLVGAAIGHGKMAVLKKDGGFIIFNEHLGEAFNGLWFSNGSYKDRPYAYGAGYSYPYTTPYRAHGSLVTAEAAGSAYVYDMSYDDCDEAAYNAWLRSRNSKGVAGEEEIYGEE